MFTIVSRQSLDVDQIFQRDVSPQRVKKLVAYIGDAIETREKLYILPAITGVVDGDTEFEPLRPGSALGILKIPYDAKFYIPDGQHRATALSVIAKRFPDSTEETVPITLFVHSGVKAIRQMFLDINQHVSKPNPSIYVAIDPRDEHAAIARAMLNLPVFAGKTALQATSLKRTEVINFFTLNSLHSALKHLLKEVPPEEHEKFALEYWKEVSETIPKWQLLVKGVWNVIDRHDTIAFHAITIEALGMLGNILRSEFPADWQGKLVGLRDVNWSRLNSDWQEAGVLTGGNITKTSRTVAALANYLYGKLV
jgi:DNA sulfur modification protein DndB